MFGETEKQLLEQKIRLKEERFQAEMKAQQDKQMAEKQEMRMEQLQRQLTLEKELAMSQAKLKAATEKFDGIAEPHQKTFYGTYQKKLEV